MKKLITLILALCMFVSLAACGGTSGGDTQSGEEKTVTLRWACNINSSNIDGMKDKSATGAFINTWIETVEAESNGTIKIDLYPDSQLASGTEAIVGGLQNGAFEIANLATGNWGEYTNALAYVQVPYLFKDNDQLHAVMDSDFGKAMEAQLENDVNVKYLGMMDIGNRVMTNDLHPVKTAADVKDIKMRVMSDPIQIACWESLGCSVSTMSSSDLFSGLQQGMVDGQENPLTYIDANSFHEVQKYMSITNHALTASCMVMNQNTWNSLSDNQKAAVEKANAAAIEAGRAMMPIEEANKIDQMADKGWEVYYPTADEIKTFQDAVAPAWENLKDLIGAENYSKLMAELGH